MSLFGQIQIPIFDRNQGEIARTGFAIAQAQEQEKFASETGFDRREEMPLRAFARTIRSFSLYRSGYLDNAQQSLDITDFAYKHGAASLLDFLDAERSNRAIQRAQLQTGACNILARARAASPGSRNQESAMKNRLIAGPIIPVHDCNCLPCCTRGLPLKRQRTGEPDDVVLFEGYEVGDSAAF